MAREQAIGAEQPQKRKRTAAPHFPGDAVRPDDLAALLTRLDAIAARQHRTLDELIPRLQASRLPKP